MKMTTTKWTNVQVKLDEMADALPETDPQRGAIQQLVSYIEYRTYGKRWSADVAIGLRGKDRVLVEQAVATLDAPVPST